MNYNMNCLMNMELPGRSTTVGEKTEQTKVLQESLGTQAWVSSGSLKPWSALGDAFRPRTGENVLNSKLLYNRLQSKTKDSTFCYHDWTNFISTFEATHVCCMFISLLASIIYYKCIFSMLFCNSEIFP